MHVPHSNLNHDFVFARLHGIWANAHHGEALERLVHSATMENLQRALQSKGIDCSSRNNFNKSLISKYLENMSKISILLDEAGTAYYYAETLHFYFTNLKSILHAKFCPKLENGAEYLLIEGGRLPKFPVEEILEAKTAKRLLELLPIPNGLTYQQLAPIITRLSENQDAMRSDCALDKLYQTHLLEKARGLSADIRGDAVRLHRIYQDIINISILLRNLRTYHLGPGDLALDWMPDGLSLPPQKLCTLSQMSSVAQAIPSLSAPYRGLLAPFGDGDELYKCENRLWNYLYSEALKIFRDFDHSARSIAVFPFLLYFETVNLGRVYEGIHFGIASRDLQNMMIGVQGDDVQTR